jgi:hypothetical protein
MKFLPNASPSSGATTHIFAQAGGFINPAALLWWRALQRAEPNFSSPLSAFGLSAPVRLPAQAGSGTLKRAPRAVRCSIGPTAPV